MTLDTIMQHVQDNLAAYAVGGVVALAIILVFRKYTIPFLYHTGEYLFYCTVIHVVLSGLIRAFSWFRSETTFKNYDGGLSKDFEAYTTPVSLNFWQKELYNPEWLFWVEVVLAVVLLYVVIVIRPTKFNRYGNRRVQQAAKKKAARDKERNARGGSQRARTAGLR